MEARFQEAYTSVQNAIDSSDKAVATQAYAELLATYRLLSASEQKEAYVKVTEAYSLISAMPNTTPLPHSLVYAARMSKLENEIPVEAHKFKPHDFIALGIFFVLISVVLFGGPEHLGLTTYNGAPAWTGVREFSTKEPFILDLATAFRDPDGDALSFLVSGASGIGVHLKGSTLTVIPTESGEFIIMAMASDETHLTKVPITVRV